MALGERAILRGKGMTGSRMDHVRWRGGQRPMQPPGHEQVLTIRMKVRQPSSILGHRERAKSLAKT
jgi:hypothetical protein